MTEEIFLQLVRDLLVGFSSSMAAQKASSHTYHPVPVTQRGSRTVNKPKPTAQAKRAKEGDRLAIRLNHAVGLILAGWRWGMSKSRLGEIVGVNSVAEFERILQDKSAMTYEFLERFGRPFGMNPTWLKHGSGEPFETLRFKEGYFVFHRVAELLKSIKEVDPTDIYFVKEKATDQDSEQEATIIFQLDDLKFQVLDAPFFVRGSDMSSNAEHSLCGFYKLLKRLDGSEPMCHGQIVDRDIFLALLRGELYPRVITQFKNESNWWFDFTDLEHLDAHEKIYGKEFVLGQEYIKKFCNDDLKTL